MTDSPNRPLDSSYPRVLIVYHACINLEDQHGVSIRGWFANWPKENLAQIYSSQEVEVGKFCDSHYKLGGRDRWFGTLFFWLKGSPLGEASLQVVTVGKDTAPGGGPSILGHARRIVGRFLLNSGLWEFIFRPRLSSVLLAWVREFRPDIIYCQGYTLGFTWLPMMLKKHFDIPICFQTTDDWPEYLYKGSPIAWLVHPIVRASAKHLIRISTLRYTIGPDMTHEYLDRYKVPFESMMQCDDYERFKKSISKRVVVQDVVSIVYGGALDIGRCQCILDLCLAADELRAEGLKFQVTGFISSAPPEGMELLRNSPILSLLAAPSHEDLPSYLKGADILFLPEPFGLSRSEEIRFSISTKAHLYMMSERPALIYAPSTTGIMSYSKQEDWGARVTVPDRRVLKDALRKLATDESYCQELVRKGREIALRRHNSSTVRESFREKMAAAVCAFAQLNSH